LNAPPIVPRHLWLDDLDHLLPFPVVSQPFAPSPPLDVQIPEPELSFTTTELEGNDMSVRKQSLSPHSARNTPSGRKTKFPVGKITDLLRKTIASRPPPGSIRWSLRHLVEVVQAQVPEAASISKETVRGILIEKLNIPSVRQIDPYWLTQVRRRSHLSVARAASLGDQSINPQQP